MVGERALSRATMLNPHYIRGLVDGEGSFTVYILGAKSGDRKRRVRAEAKFYLKLIEKDRDILYQLRDFFGCGSVYFQKDRRPNHQHCYRYEVSSRQDLSRKIIPFFRKHQLQLKSKRNDFEHFCVLVEMMETGDHLTEEGLVKMRGIKRRMH